MRFNISKDGQIVSYSKDGETWHDINYQKWSSLILEIISRTKLKIADQMPAGMTISDLTGDSMLDNLSRQAPYKQDGNKAHVELTTKEFHQKMVSPMETHHQLAHTDGTLNKEKVQKYIKNDQTIKGLLCALLSSCNAVPLRPWQFGSILFDSSEEADRNLWIVDHRFVAGKPKAKQIHLTFADTLFWLPRDITLELIALLYYQQPFIGFLLDSQNTPDHLYASHIWALPPTISNKNPLKVWSGTAANQCVKDLTQQIIGLSMDPSLMRQSSEALLWHKIPVLFQIFHSRENLHLEKGSYRHKLCLDSYANHHGIARLAHAADIPADRASACLIIGDIWQSMHKIEDANPIWKPMVTNSYIFPMDTYDALAYLEAQNQKIIAQTTFKAAFDIDNLTGGVGHLTDINALEANVCSLTSKTILHLIFK